VCKKVTASTVVFKADSLEGNATATTERQSITNGFSAQPHSKMFLDIPIVRFVGFAWWLRVFYVCSQKISETPFFEKKKSLLQNMQLPGTGV
jgi:hypothetical protein